MQEPRTHLADLPAELLIEIFGYLDVRSKFVCRRVSQQWRCCLEDTSRDLWQRLDLPPGFYTLDWRIGLDSPRNKRLLHAQSADAVIQAIGSANGRLTVVNMTAPVNYYWSTIAILLSYRNKELWKTLTAQPSSATIKIMTIRSPNRDAMPVLWKEIKHFQALERLHIDDSLENCCPTADLFSGSERTLGAQTIDLPCKFRKIILTGHQGEWSHGYNWHIRGSIEELYFDSCLYLRTAEFDQFGSTLHTIEARNCDIDTESVRVNGQSPRVPLDRFTKLRRFSLKRCVVGLSGPLPEGLQVLSVDSCMIHQDFTEGKASGLESRQPLKVWHFDDE